MRRSLLCFFAVVSACSSVLADFTFIHVSDIHIGAGKNHETDAQLFAEIAALPQKPLFVVNTGDVCEYGTDAEYELYRETIKSLGSVKMYPAPGNHDVRWNPRGKEGYVLGTNTPLYQSWDHDGVHFVTLDSTVLLNHWGHISQEQLNWLKADLEKVGTETPVIIGFHHWVGRETVQVDNEQKLLDLVAPYNVVLWLQGHGHSDIQWNVNGVAATMLKGLYQGSYNIIEKTDDELIISKRHVPAGPKSNELIRDKSVPDASIPPVTKELMRVPLKKRPAPRVDANPIFSGDDLVIDVKTSSDAKLAYRLGSGKPVPVEGHKAKVPIGDLIGGEHVVTLLTTQNDGRVYQTPVPFRLSRGGIEPAWSINIGGEVQSRLVLDEGTLYVSSMGNDLIALDTSNGSEKFRTKTGGPIFTGSHLDNGIAYFGSADHHVYAADAKTGEVEWKQKTGGAVLAGPNVARGVVCVGSTDTKIYGLDAATGSVKWTVAGKNMYQAKTGTDGESFYVGGWDNMFRAIDAESGKERWSIPLGRKGRDNFSAFSPAITAPAVGNGMVYVSTNDGILHALNTSDGKEAWQIDWKKMGYSSPLLHEGRIYAALSDEGKVFCADAKTGSMLWQAETGAVIYDSSFCFGGGTANPHVFIGNVNGTVNAIDAKTGKISWQYRLAPGHLLGSPVADDTHVYVGSMSGQVVKLPISTGPKAE